MRLALLVSLLALTACPRSPATPPPDADAAEPAPLGDADPEASVDDAASKCATSCARLHALHCPEGEPAPNGVTCAELCNRRVRAGYGSYDTACLVHAQTVDAAEACGVRCRP